MMANQDNTPPNDCIVVQTDFAFDIVNRLITKLNNDHQLELQSMQDVQIKNIRSNNQREDSSLVFGSAQSFARTTSSVLRMCMLRSANVPGDLYPNLRKHSMRRNEAAMDYSQTDGNEFVLTTNKDRAREYYSHYDQLYPHFKIEDQLCTAEQNQLKKIPGTMMFIFRRNFSEIIAFDTSLQVKYCPKDGGHSYESFAHVNCLVRKICDPNHVCVKVLRLMKGGYWSMDVMLCQLSKVNWVKEENTESEPGTKNESNDGIKVPPMQPSDSLPMQPIAIMQPQMPTSMQPQMQIQQPGVVRPQNQLSQNQYGQPQAPQPDPQNGLGEQFASLNIGQPESLPQQP